MIKIIYKCTADKEYFKQLQIKPKKNSEANGIQTHDLCNTGAMLYQLSCEASLEAGQVQVVYTYNCLYIHVYTYKVDCLSFCSLSTVVRTLTGHKSSIKCLDFHPYGDFVASGSLDTNLKVSLHCLSYFVCPGKFSLGLRLSSRNHVVL